MLKRLIVAVFAVIKKLPPSFHIYHHVKSTPRQIAAPSADTGRQLNMLSAILDVSGHAWKTMAPSHATAALPYHSITAVIGSPHRRAVAMLSKVGL